MAKAIKSFTVDGNVYNALVKTFKASGAEVSLSLFVNNCLEELFELLKKVDKKLKERKDHTVTMSFIIKSIVESKDILGVGKDWPDDLPEKIDLMLHDWQEDYDAHGKKVPIEFYSYLKTGLYILSPNKKYLIEKKTGKKFLPVSKHKLASID
jgi:hypothetical protein